MRVAVLGAATSIGRRVASDLVERPDVEQVVLGDPDGAAAAMLASQLDGSRASAVEVTGPVGYAEALAVADVAVGCLAAGVEAELAAARAAIESRVPYLSGGVDSEIVEALLGLDQAARSADVLVVAGLSWTPGITNILALAGAATLDRVREVRVAWTVSCTGPDGEEALSRAMRALSGYAVVFEDGAWHRDPAGSAAEEIFFPEPVGWQAVHIAAGAEALTLPASVEGLERCVVKGGVGERIVDRMVRKIAGLADLSSSKRRERLGGMVRPLLPALGRFGASRQGWSAARVDVAGESGGGPAVATFGLVDQLSNLTSAPLVAGALMAGRGEIKGRGVLPPEVAADAGDLLSALAARGVRVARLER